MLPAVAMRSETSCLRFSKPQIVQTFCNLSQRLVVKKPCASLAVTRNKRDGVSLVDQFDDLFHLPIFQMKLFGKEHLQSSSTHHAFANCAAILLPGPSVRLLLPSEADPFPPQKGNRNLVSQRIAKGPLAPFHRVPDWRPPWYRFLHVSSGRAGGSPYSSRHSRYRLLHIGT